MKCTVIFVVFCATLFAVALAAAKMSEMIEEAEEQKGCISVEFCSQDTDCQHNSVCKYCTFGVCSPIKEEVLPAVAEVEEPKGCLSVEFCSQDTDCQHNSLCKYCTFAVCSPIKEEDLPASEGCFSETCHSDDDCAHNSLCTKCSLFTCSPV